MEKLRVWLLVGFGGPAESLQPGLHVLFLLCRTDRKPDIHFQIKSWLYVDVLVWLIFSASGVEAGLFWFGRIFNFLSRVKASA